MKLRLAGYGEKRVQLDRTTDQKISELLEALPKRGPRLPGTGRLPKTGSTATGKPGTGPNKSPTGGKDEQPRIVD